MHFNETNKKLLNIFKSFKLKIVINLMNSIFLKIVTYLQLNINLQRKNVIDKNKNSESPCIRPWFFYLTHKCPRKYRIYVGESATEYQKKKKTLPEKTKFPL